METLKPSSTVNSGPDQRQAGVPGPTTARAAAAVDAARSAEPGGGMSAARRAATDSSANGSRSGTNWYHELAPQTKAFAKTLVALGLLTFFGNYFSLSLHYGLDFLFGSVFVLLAAALFGPWWACGVAIFGSLYTLPLWHHPYAIVIAVAEAIFVGVLARRTQRSILLIDGAFWFLAAIPIIFVIYAHLLNFNTSQTYLIYVKDAANGLLNALFASLIISIASARGWLVKLARITGTPPAYDRKAPLAYTLFNVLVSTVLVPTILLTVVNGRQARTRIESQIDADLGASATLLRGVTRRWHENHRNALGSIVERYNDEGQRRMVRDWQLDLTFVKRSLPDFTAVYAADRNGRAFVFEPRRAVQRQSMQGQGRPVFSDRAYFQQLRETRSAVTSGVLSGRLGDNKPVIAIAVPYFTGGSWQGYVAGSIDMDNLTRLLQTSLTKRNFEATVVDYTGSILASTRENAKPGSRYARRAPRGVSLYQWTPTGRNLAAVQRWSSSYRIHRVAMGPGIPWELYIEAPNKEPQRELESVYAFNLTTALCLIAGAFFIATILASTLATPLDELARATTDMPSHLLRRGMKSENQWPQSRVREIDRLIANFRSMEASLRLTMQENLKARGDLEAERERLDEANRLKDDFLAVLSHELRTPLVPVLGYADLIARGVLKGDDATDAARSVERNARAQLRLIEDLLDVSAIMSGKIRLQMGVVNLQLVTREAGETMRIRAHDADIGLFFDLDEGTPLFWGDAARLRQVVWNLISNAVKFTPSGGNITVRLTHHQNKQGDRFGTIVVSDTGLGIEPDFLPYIFDRFRQAGDHMTRHAGGLGLGLAIVQHFVEMHGGTISASSDGLDRGSTFTVILPLVDVPRESGAVDAL